jgi:hypothetical protein
MIAIQNAPACGLLARMGVVGIVILLKAERRYFIFM